MSRARRPPRRAARAGWTLGGTTSCSALDEGSLYAYGARCPACDADLGRRRARRPHAGLSGLRAGLRYVQAGRAIDRGDLHLEPVPDPHPGRTHPDGPAAAASGGRAGVTMRPPDLTRGAASRCCARFAKARAPVERCDLCGLEVAPMHDHLIEPAERAARLRLWRLRGALQRAGRAPVQAGATHVDRARRASRISDAQWEALRLPIDLAFFYDSTPQARVVACYPSPAGATESLLELETWQELRREHPVLHDLAARRRGAAGQPGPARPGVDASAISCPIDQCFQLVGLIRMHWKGFTGGTAVWEEIDRVLRRPRPAWPVRRRRRFMPDLNFQVEGPRSTPYAMVPLLRFRLRVTQRRRPTRRSTPSCSAARSRSSRPGGTTSPRRRSGSATCSASPSAGARRSAPCSGPTPASSCRRSPARRSPICRCPARYDFNVAATKYFYALEDGEVPLDFLFSGSVFYQDARRARCR